MVTSNLVIAESYALIHRADGHRPAQQFLQALRHASRVTIAYSDADLEDSAEDILARYADQDFSYVDAVSFALMRQRGIAEAFAFDHHVVAARFALLAAREP
jgi:predicted nucleic acid-binding protein